MKTIQSNLRKSLFVTIILLSSVFLFSCLPETDKNQIPDAAFVSIFHGAPLTSDLDVFAESRMITQNPIKYGESFPYSRFFPGNRLLRFSPGHAVNTLLEEEFRFKKDSIYTVFLFNEESELKAIQIKDVWEEPNAEKAQIRLIHLSADTGQLTVIIDDSPDFFKEGLEFTQSTEFKSIDKGKHDVKVVASQTGETLLTVGEIELRGNRVYTLMIRGFENPTIPNNPLSVQILTNFIKFQ